MLSVLPTVFVGLGFLGIVSQPAAPHEASERAVAKQATAEVTRLRHWFAEVEVQLGDAPVDHLDPTTQAARQGVLAALHDYAEAGLFPRGRPGTWGPTFMDAEHTRCAVAALMEVTGEDALAERIAVTQNLAEVIDFADDPEVLAWLDAHGLTTAEAMAIQPSYEPEPVHCICGEAGYGAAAVVEVEPGPERAVVRVRRIVARRDGFEVPETLPWHWSPLSQRRVIQIIGQDPWTYARLPLSSPCPAALPYPTTPPPWDLEGIAAAVVAPNCLERLAALDARWAYTVPEGCAASPGHTGGGWLTLLLAWLLTGRRRGPGKS
jgi:hypothetical protein